MGFKMPSVLVVVGLVFAGVGLIFQIVGVASAGWLTYEHFDAETGLWMVCNNGKCDRIPQAEVWLRASRAFGILGIVILAGCLLAGCLMCCLENNKLPLGAAILGFVAGVCILIEFATYAANREHGTSYGYSFAFHLAIAAGVFFILAKMKP